VELFSELDCVTFPSALRRSVSRRLRGSVVVFGLWLGAVFPSAVVARCPSVSPAPPRSPPLPTARGFPVVRRHLAHALPASLRSVLHAHALQHVLPILPVWCPCCLALSSCAPLQPHGTASFPRFVVPPVNNDTVVFARSQRGAWRQQGSGLGVPCSSRSCLRLCCTCSHAACPTSTWSSQPISESFQRGPGCCVTLARLENTYAVRTIEPPITCCLLLLPSCISVLPLSATPTKSCACLACSPPCVDAQNVPASCMRAWMPCCVGSALGVPSHLPIPARWHPRLLG
jgi:hypothetical protein